eukprot:TRINITY_DN9253_c0_g1_i1.p1 TRINITY_DN9253_c0_g1~~TRINITY_DN9253_c0_g1_i1.p1  ORF type:complete len:369 (-),score=50.20 TRINITY_DN9253_c0_g1_i1:142-1248(-)
MSASHFSVVQIEVIRGILYSCCTLSFFGSFSIILAFCLFPELRTTNRKILLFISLADLITITAYILPPWQESACKVSSLINMYSSISSFLWTLCLAFFLYLKLMNKRSSDVAEKLLPVFFVLSSILVPIGCVTSIALMDQEGRDERLSPYWCWLKGAEEMVRLQNSTSMPTTHPSHPTSPSSILSSSITEHNNLYEAELLREYLELMNSDVTFTESSKKLLIISILIGGKAIEWSCLLLSLFFFILSYWRLRKYARSPENEWQMLIGEAEKHSSPSMKFLCAPLILCCLRIPSAIRSLRSIANPEHPVDTAEFIFAILQAMGDPAQGFANGLLFVGFTSKVREKYYSLFSRFFRSISSHFPTAYQSIH